MSRDEIKNKLLVSGATDDEAEKIIKNVSEITAAKIVQLYQYRLTPEQAKEIAAMDPKEALEYLDVHKHFLPKPEQFEIDQVYHETWSFYLAGI